MKVLVLGAENSPVSQFLRDCGHDIIETSERLNEVWVDGQSFDCVVSYRYRHIIKLPIIAKFPDRIINLHISLLPWNRGADPNLWSWLEDTPKGVSIHLVDEGVDAGSVLVQNNYSLDADEHTLVSSYDFLNSEILKLFQDTWSDFADGNIIKKPKIQGGTHHYLKDKEPYMHLLTEGWNTPIKNIVGAALCQQHHLSTTRDLA